MHAQSSDAGEPEASMSAEETHETLLTGNSVQKVHLWVLPSGFANLLTRH